MSLTEPEDPNSAGQAVIAVVVRQQKLLVIRRSAWVRAPGQYCFPGGTIEPGESQREALVREFREELGGHVRPIRLIWTSRTARQVQLHWWLAELATPTELSPNAAEVEHYCWLELEQIRKLPQLLPSNHRFLDALDCGDATL